MRQLKISKSITNRDSASLERFLSDISKVQMIGADEEVELARKIKAGDEDALNKLVTTNLRFVVSVAKQYQNQGIGLQDLINEGNLGLIKAAQRSTRRAASSLSPTLFGGSAKPFCRPSPTSRVS